MIDLSVDDAGDAGTLTLSGGITIQHAAQLKDTLLEGISAAKGLVIDLSEVDRVDLSAIQLLFAAHRGLNDKGKSLTVAGTIPEAWHNAVKESGYSGSMNADDTTGLWTGEGK
ncbi:MAG: STAS domain-containing protein [Magnetococcales bacterium]|nr:STAS domain-containing protein [Magnetococcales bacterium]MBF0418688.1 STAS domain-containing protein [Magnetococcales bacterium]MBF0434058.1 STAS domain-containing protein [Magnetococcales bacterium]